MSLDEYQLKALKTAIYPGSGEVLGLAYVGLGLGEAGEIQGKIKKILRDDNGVISDEKKEAIAAEAGDLLWYIALLAKELNYTLEEIAIVNLVKLDSRKERGVLGGSGDYR
ncbi:MazG-like pyrophosphatase [Rhodococcus phage Trina]|uniref:Nucleotide pyrophosphohydrolase n=1 Tax=Rhodococcus phage Trina TaxID=2027905 RepID=A0A2D0ZNH8_9CAUD|nr:MazG-like pyrophosphatase [Rhodococcus phage Trina]ASZ74918.1 nucleotide pyrophosphohydrolase [Rhodococcus phage Trina]